MDTGRWFRITFVSGLLGAFALLEAPALGLLVLAVIALLSMRLGRDALSGLLIGVGAGVIVLLGQAQLRCAQDAHCTAPDVTVWFVCAALATLAGVLLLMSVRLRVTRPQP
jgi:chromate transport protein ChrA